MILGDNTRLIIVDHSPATPLPALLNKTEVILISPQNKNQVANLTTILKKLQCMDDPCIVIAAGQGDIAYIRNLIEGGASVHETTNSGLTALHEAANKSHIKVAKYIIQAGAFVNATTLSGFTALHFAALNGNAALVELFLEHGADIEARSIVGETPLYVAARSGQMHLVNLFLEKKANIDIQISAENHGFLFISRHLIMTNFTTPIIEPLVKELWIMKARFCKEVTQNVTLLGCGAIAEAGLSERDHFSPLNTTAYHEVQSILEAITKIVPKLPNVNINYQTVRQFPIDRDGAKGFTLLAMATIVGEHKIAKIILDTKANVNLADESTQFTPLHYACRFWHPNIVKILLQYNANLNLKEVKQGRTALHTCIYYGEIEGMKALLEKGASTEDTDEFGNTPLFLAVLQKNHMKPAVAIVKTLIEHGANYKHKDQLGWTAFRLACNISNIGIIEYMLENGYAALDSTDNEGQTTFQWAVANGRDNVVQIMTDHNISLINSDDKHGNAPLHVACKNYQAKIINMLLQKETLIVDAVNVFGQTPLHVCSIYGEIEGIKGLLAAGANTDYRDKEGSTPMMNVVKGADCNKLNNSRFPVTTCHQRYTEVLKLMLEKDSGNISTRDKNGRTLLYWATKSGQEEIVTLLLGHRASQLINEGDENNITPLHVACDGNHSAIVNILLQQNSIAVDPVEMLYNTTPLHECIISESMEGIKALLTKGAFIDHRDIYGNTPLLNAVTIGHMPAALLLIEKGANVNAINNSTRSVLQWACQKISSSYMTRVLISAGADYSYRNCNGRIAFSIACSSNNLEVVKYMLVNRVADVSSVDKEGRTPLFWAVQNGHSRVVKVLLENGLDQLNTANNTGYTPLHVVGNSMCVLNVLLAYNPDKSLITKIDGLTAEQLAWKNNHTKVAERMKYYWKNSDLVIC